MKRRRRNPPLLPDDPGWPSGWRIILDDQTDKEHRWVVILQEGKMIGRLGLAPSNIADGAWGVFDASIEPGYEGRGLGQALYLVAMRLLGRVHPDWEQAVSFSAMRVWKTLRDRGLIVGEKFPGFEKKHGARISRNTEFDDGDHVNVENGRYYIDAVFPKGWKGVLDQVYRLKDPASVPLVEIRRD